MHAVSHVTALRDRLLHHVHDAGFIDLHEGGSVLGFGSEHALNQLDLAAPDILVEHD